MDPESCPHCHNSLQGAEIPETSRHFYGNATHFSRLIGISNGDSIHTWKCPDCNHEWPRTGPPSPGVFRTTSVEIR